MKRTIIILLCSPILACASEDKLDIYMTYTKSDPGAAVTVSVCNSDNCEDNKSFDVVSPTKNKRIKKIRGSNPGGTFTLTSKQNAKDYCTVDYKYQYNTGSTRNFTTVTCPRNLECDYTNGNHRTDMTCTTPFSD